MAVCKDTAEMKYLVNVLTYFGLCLIHPLNASRA